MHTSKTNVYRTSLRDNTATSVVVNGNDIIHERVKHVTVKARFLQECVQRKIILLGQSFGTYLYESEYCRYTMILTKQSSGSQFHMHRNDSWHE